MGSRSQNLSMKPKKASNAVLFKEITRKYTLPIDLLYNLAPKNRIYGLVEIDVTKARKFIYENEERTGEKLSFTAWVMKCVAHALNEHKEIQAFKKGKTKLIIFDDIDIGIIIERQGKAGRIPTQYVVRKANEKSFRQIHEEIRGAQRIEANERYTAAEGILPSSGFFRRLPGFLRKPLTWRKIKSDPLLRKRLIGTVGITAVGMFGKGGGWAIPIGLHPVVFALGGISKKQKNFGISDDVGEFLNITIMFDEEVTFGAPATRFISRLSELMQMGFGLE
jgi:pyruvate/2-oxoglutarate dehydrogenase complex dihydrolipoamide acyltransferase (E2) component